MAFGEDAEELALEAAEGERRSLLESAGVVAAVKEVDPSLRDEGAVGGGDVVAVEGAGEVDAPLVLGVVASDTLGVPDGLDDFFV